VLVLLDCLITNTGSVDVEPFEYQIIDGIGNAWFYDPIDKILVEVPRGIEVVQISENPDSEGRVLVRAPFQFLMIPQEEIIDIGFY
jgi:hypothetical protein